MSDMLNTKTNEYAPRLYPKDTPAEAAARLAGFEAGRQYEASLRDDVPATLIPAAEFAALDPWLIEEGYSVGWCFFCKEIATNKHRPDCLWIRCGGKP